ncbi:MAG: hypothetical protein ACLQVN_04310 [Bryobacteraceae bacterium]
MKITRRALSLGLFAPLAVASPLPPPQETPRRRLRFKEVAASLYTWDMAAESIESILDTLRETAQVNSVYFMAMMHGEERPLTDLYFPRSLQPTKTLVAEDARANWRPHPEFYKDSRIKPRLSGQEEIRKTDYLAVMTAAARKAGCTTGAEISHTVMDRERASGEFIDTIQRDIWGNPLGRLVCHNNPDIRAYLTAMFTDLVANYDIDYLMTAILPMAYNRPPVMVGMGGEGHTPGAFAFGFWSSLPPDFREALLRTTLGGCFCEHCQKAAAAKGLDLGAIRRAMLPLANMVDHADEAQEHRLKVLSESGTSGMAVLLRHPEIFDLVKFRCMTMAGLYQHLHGAMVGIKPKIDFRDNAHIGIFPEFAGLEYASLKPFLGSVRSSNYSEQTGKADQLQVKRRFLLSLRDALGDEFPMYSAIATRPPATPDLVRKAVVLSAECGADGLSVAHYDSSPLPYLRAISEGLKEAGVTVG